MQYASPKYDPGVRDLFDSFKEKIERHKSEEMDNVKIVPNNGLVVSDYKDYPVTDQLYDISASYKISDQKRNYALIIVDMQNGYESFVRYCIPPVKLLLETFRELNLPVLWTNWNRRHDDGMYGALDRFYGPQGIDSKHTTCYVYGEDAN